MTVCQHTAVALTLAILLASAQVSHGEEPAALDALRRNVAMAYSSAESHGALAKHHFDHGNRLLAFYILENMRRAIATPAEFHSAFDKLFRNLQPVDGSPEAETALKAALEAKPDDAELHQKLSDVYAARSDWKKAEECTRTVVQLRPDDFAPVRVLAGILLRQKRRAEAEATENAFAESHPDSEAAWSRRVVKLMLDRDDDAAKEAAEAARKKFPLNGEFDFQLGVLAQRRSNLSVAKRHFAAAANKSPDNAQIQGRVGRFFLKAMNDETESLEYYLRAYFVEPEFYDTEFAESRIRSLNWDAAAREFQSLMDAGTPIEKCMAHENPVVVNFAIRSLMDAWDPKFAPSLVEVMLHDDPNLRWQATDALMKNVDHSFDAQLHALLEDKDLRRRGLALYIAGRRWKESSFKYLTANLSEEAELLRFDAISALIEQGGDQGRKIVVDYASSGREKSSWMQSVLQGVMQRGEASANPGRSD